MTPALLRAPAGNEDVEIADASIFEIMFQPGKEADAVLRHQPADPRTRRRPESSRFQIWVEESGLPLPLRIEYQPKSYLSPIDIRSGWFTRCHCCRDRVQHLSQVLVRPNQPTDRPPWWPTRDAPRKLGFFP